MHSKWNAIDLHIHSKFSNKVKGKGDYTGEEYSAKELLETLKNEGIGIFSITDHNSVNIELYRDIEGLIIDDYDYMNYIIGVEIDVYDVDVYDQVFHCLCFFESRKVEIIEKSINELFDNISLEKRISKEVYPDIKKIFSIFSNNSIHNILLVPHFNNKDKSIPQNIAIEHLNYLCFNAYEDSNNIKNISKSLSIYLKAGFDNFPFVVFSDNHDLKKYPESKSGNIGSKCNILSTIEYPFSSVKTAFQEPRMRISINEVSNMRKIVNEGVYIKKIQMGNKILNLSPSQNTIIGKFGSGKSLLLNKIDKGIFSLEDNERYKQLYDVNEQFKLYMGEGEFSSLTEALTTNTSLKRYQFVQQEEFYYKNELNINEAKDLFGRLNIDFNFTSNDSIDLKDNFSKTFLEYMKLFNQQEIVNSFNYERAFSEDEYYTITGINSIADNYNDILDSISELKDALIKVKSKSLYEQAVFNPDELNKIDSFTELLEEKYGYILTIKNSDFEKKLTTYTDKYNTTYINNNAKDAKEKIVSDFEQFTSKIIKLFKETCDYSCKYDEEVYEGFKSHKDILVTNEFTVRRFINVEEEYKDIVDHLFTAKTKQENLFLSLISAVFNKFTLQRNKPLTEISKVITIYNNKINALTDINNTFYDLIYKGQSLLKKSAGEKSSQFINLIFNLIEKELCDDKSVIMILDQPEDNIDNENTFNIIASKIRKMKLKYNKLQFIIVTHNANVGIAADSENIIIASEEIVGSQSKKFKYNNGSIENVNHIEDVCQVLEGGKDALKKRSLKYGVNIIRKVEQHGV